MIKARLLGEFHVEVGGQPVRRFRTHKSAQLLAYLLRYPERHPRERLRTLFWGDMAFDAAQNNLRVSLAYLRRLLEPVGIPAGTVLRSDRRSVGLNPDAIETDVAAFERAIQEAEQAETDNDRHRFLKAATSLFQDEFLKGFSDPWVLAERERLQLRFERLMQQVEPSQSAGGTFLRTGSTPATTFPTGLGLVLGIESEQSLIAKRGWIEQVLRVCQGGWMELSDSSVRAYFTSLHNLMKGLDAFVNALPDVHFALDVGELRYTMGRYTGLPLETVEQLLSVGFPGQILCTERVALLLPQNRAAPRYVSHHLGCFRLGERSSNEQIFQLDRAGHARTFPPLKAHSPLRRCLINVPTAFIGREIECSLLRTWLQNNPGGLMTLLGAPGVGKSRLMLECARQSEAVFGQAIWWLALHKPEDPLQEVLARRLGWEWQGFSPLVSRLGAVLDGQPALILIDVALHLSEDQKTALQQLRRAIPSMICLVASQSPTGLKGEQCFLVDPLSLPEKNANSVEALLRSSAVRLFLERAQSVSPNFRLTRDKTTWVRDILFRTEGLPLAIELTAARVGNYSLPEIAHQLEHSLEWAKGRPAGTMSHSLYASLEAAYQDLPQEAQKLLRFLSCFRGGASIQLLRDACPSSTLESDLDWLIQASLLLKGNDRYRLLNIIRTFVQQQKTSETERQEAHRAQLQHCIHLARQLHSPSPAWQQLEQERPNCEAALEWATNHHPALALQLANALAPFWERCGSGKNVDELIKILPQHLTSSAEQLQAARIELELTVRRGDLDRSKLLLHRFLPLAESCADSLPALRFWITTGFYFWMQGQTEESIRYLQRAARLADLLNARLEQAEALNHLGVAFWIQENLDAAASALESAIEIASPHESPLLRVKALSNLANVLYQRGEHSQAEGCLVATLQLARQTEDRRTIATLLTNWSVWLREKGDLARARELCTQAASLWQELNEGIGEAATLNNLADIALDEKDLTTASTLFRRSLQCVLRYRLFWYLPNLAQNLAAISVQEGCQEQAKHWQSVRLLTGLRFSQSSHIISSLDELTRLALDTNDTIDASYWYTVRQSFTSEQTPDDLSKRMCDVRVHVNSDEMPHEAEPTRQTELIERLFPVVERMLAPFCSYPLHSVLLCE